MTMSVEEYLESIGFVGPYHRKNGEDYIVDRKHIGNFSSMGSLANKWKHPDGRVMTYGLYEGDHGPTICNPRPVVRNQLMEDGSTVSFVFDAHDIDRYLAEHGVAATVAKCFEG